MTMGKKMERPKNFTDVNLNLPSEEFDTGSNLSLNSSRSRQRRSTKKSFFAGKRPRLTHKRMSNKANDMSKLTVINKQKISSSFSSSCQSSRHNRTPSLNFEIPNESRGGGSTNKSVNTRKSPY